MLLYILGCGGNGRETTQVRILLLLWIRLIQQIGHMQILQNSFVQSSTVIYHPPFDIGFKQFYDFFLDPDEWADIFAASGAKYVLRYSFDLK